MMKQHVLFKNLPLLMSNYMKKTFALIVLLFFLKPSIFACPLCSKEIRDAVYDSQFYPNLLIMLSAFIVLSIIVVIMTALSNKRHITSTAANPNVQVLSPVPLTTASTVLGIGFGGFVDGIVLHQILQVHEMLSNKIPATDYIGKSVNMFWDGIFHAFCLIVAIVGVILLWKLMLRNDVDRSGKLCIAGLLFGWGIFNLVEGIIDHQILGLHNVIEYATNHKIGNYAFLGISIIMIIIGWNLISNENKKRYAI
jgi:uncharacterized membrane protein